MPSLACIGMAWTVQFHPDFETEFLQLDPAVQIEIIAGVALLETVGPGLKRPHADTLSGSKLKNLKEYRFKADNGVWRMAYAFDPKRKAILLCAGDKSGVSKARFYGGLIAKAEERYAQHLETIK